MTITKLLLERIILYLWNKEIQTNTFNEYLQKSLKKVVGSSNIQ